MRKTIRHVAVAAAAVAMLTAIAVPAQGKGGIPDPPDVFQLACAPTHHYVVAVAADEFNHDWNLSMTLSIRTPDGTVTIDQERVEGTGPLQVRVEGYVSSYQYFVSVILGWGGPMHHSYWEIFSGYC